MTTYESCPECDREFTERRDSCPYCDWEVQYRDKELLNAVLRKAREHPFLAVLAFAMVCLIYYATIGQSIGGLDGGDASRVTATNTSRGSAVSFQVVAQEDMASLGSIERLQVSILVPASIRRGQVGPTMRKALNQVRSNHPGVDEINVLAYSDRDLLGSTYDVARAVWSTDGELGNIPPEVGRSDDRSGYAVAIRVKENLEEYLAQRGREETRSGLAEEERREIFRALVRAEHRSTREANQRYPTSMNCVSAERARANVERNAGLSNRLMRKYKRQVREEYGISEETARNITVEAMNEQWPMPDPPPSSC